jgi:type I restriction enzyme S subunit
MAAVSDELGLIAHPETRPYGSVRQGYTHFINGDVIFAKITPCMENGKSAVARDLLNGIGGGSTEFFVLRTRGAVLPEFLHSYLRQQSYRDEARAAMRSAAGHARVPKDFIRQTRIPVPPLSEQRRILSRLEQLETERKSTRAHLSTIPAELVKTRVSVLADAFSGRLTFDWRERRKPGWPTLSLREVISDLKQGWSPRCDNSPALPSKWGIIKTTAIQPMVFLDGENKALPSYFKPKPSLEIKIGDVLITRKGPRARAGVTAFVSHARRKLMVCDTAYRLRVSPSTCEPRFLAYLLNSPSVIEEIDTLTA